MDPTLLTGECCSKPAEVINDSPNSGDRSRSESMEGEPSSFPEESSLTSGDEIDKSGLIKILGNSSYSMGLVTEVMKGIKKRVDPIPVDGGTGGAYCFRNCQGDCVAIVKPTDEEPLAPNNPKGLRGKSIGQPGLYHSVRVGEAGYREVAAYLLDHDHFANVPTTVLVRIAHSIFNINDGVNRKKLRNMEVVSRTASLQQYIQHDYVALDHGTSNFPVASVHRIGILDIRIFNLDRHAGNLLVRKLDSVGKFGQVELIPIDHGLCLPEAFEDPCFEWIRWPQASIPFSDDECKYISNLDPFSDSNMLRTELPMIREASLRVFILCTIFLKEATTFGLCLSEIGEMMRREFVYHGNLRSELEIVCLQAKRILIEKQALHLKPMLDNEDVQFNTDTKDDLSFSPRTPEECMKSHMIFDESVEDEETKIDAKLRRPDKSGSHLNSCHVSTTSKLSKSIDICGRKSTISHLGVSSLETSTELLSIETSYVTFVDMNEKAWSFFLESFQDALHPAFVKHKSLSTSQKQRLGTSCKF